MNVSRSRMFNARVAAAAVVAVVAVGVGAAAWSLADKDDDGDTTTAVQPKAVVEQRALTTSTQFPAQYQISAAMTVLAPPPIEGAARHILTGAPPKPGESVPPGSVIAEINYRPIMVLLGDLAPYRDIRPGMTGPDVGTLQRGLRGMGQSIPDGEIGRFGHASQQAIKAIYDKAGFAPEYTAGSAEATNAAVKQARDEARAAYQTAKDAYARGENTTELNNAVQAAKARADEVERTSGVMVRAAWIATINTSEAVVGDVSVKVGDTISAAQPLATLNSGNVSVKATINSAQAALVSDGAAVQVTGQNGKCTAAAPTGPPADTKDAPAAGTPPGDGAADATANPTASPTTPAAGDKIVTITCNPAPAINLVGTDTTATVITEVAPASSLIVPASALVYAADGTATIKPAKPATKSIAVTVIGESDGFVAIESQDSALTPGIEVLVNT